MSYQWDSNNQGYPSEAYEYTLNQHISKTFLWMVLGLLITFFVAISSWLSGIVYLTVNFHVVWLIITLVLSVTMATRIEQMSVGSAKAIFVAFSVLFGITMSVYLVLFELTSVIFVFFLTAVYFGAMAAYGRFTRRDLSSLRSILFGSLVVLIVFGLLSWIFPVFTAFDGVVCLIGIAVFLAYTAYDTQQICRFYYAYEGDTDMLEKAAIFSALQLYLDFLNLFVYLLRFVGKRRD